MSEPARADDAAALILHLARLGAAVVESSRNDLAQLRSLVQDASRNLTHSFDSLQQGVGRQREAIHDLVERGAEGEGGLTQFVADANGVLGALVDQLLRVTDRGREVQQSVAQLVAQLERANAVTLRTKKIADQTRLLAINAKIQAVHAGEFGASFMVVADEVDGLAREVRHLNDEVAELVGSTIVEAKGAASAIGDSAAHDAEAAQASRSRAEALLRSVAGIEASMAVSVEAVAKQSSEIADGVSTAVRSLQFEDIATQVATHGIRVLETLGSALRQLAAGEAHDPERTLARAREVLAALDAHLETGAKKPAQQSDLAAGGVELF